MNKHSAIAIHTKNAVKSNKTEYPIKSKKNNKNGVYLKPEKLAFNCEHGELVMPRKSMQ